jgi:cytosine/adenosine deaminase-related metal-dependent hydrolase
MVDEEGLVARTLLDIATQGGASSLGVPAGTITPGAWADFSAVDIESPLLAGTPPVTLLEGMVSGADGRIVTATAVGGHWRTHQPAGGA